MNGIIPYVAFGVRFLRMVSPRFVQGVVSVGRYFTRFYG